MSKLNLNPLADWGYVNNSRFSFLSIRNQGGGVEPVPPEPPVPTDRVLYTVVEGGYKPSSTWITENCSENVFDAETGEGYLVLNEGVTTLEGRYIEEPEMRAYTIFKDYYEDFEDYNITSIIIPTQVTSIDKVAFAAYTSLKSVTIPNSITFIGDNSFVACSQLSKVICNATIPPELGDGVFNDIGTRHCTVPEGCEDAYLNSDWTIYFDSFGPPMNIEIKYTATAKISSEWITENCSENVFDVTTGKGILHATTNMIGEYAFKDCIDLTSITIPEAINHIGYSAFYGCNNMTKVYYNAINCSIDSNSREPLFSNITEIILGNTVKIIPNGLYIRCNNLTSITFPNSVREIKSRAFDNCPSLSSITIPNSVTKIDTSAFYSCNNLTSVNFYAGNCILEGTPFANCSSLETINFGNITRIPENICYGLSTIKYINIPNSVIEIGEYAFCGCHNVISNVIIPDSVNSIGADAFYDIPNIIYHGTATGSSWGANFINKWYENKMLFDDDGKETLLKYYDSSYQGTVIIPDSVTSIGNSAFASCNLTSVTIPNSVTSIGNSAFEYCGELTSVTIGNSVNSIGERAFYHCSGLTSITIPNSVTSIGNNTFRNCSGLTSVIIPDSVKTIGMEAFRNCSGLTSITIGTDVEYIDAFAFDYCNNLTTVNFNAISCNINYSNPPFPNSIQTVIIGDNVIIIPESIFDGKNSLTSVTIGNSVTNIGNYAFRNCGGITSITIPDSVETIGNGAFYGCSGLTSITIPNSVTSIGNNTFRNCSGLTSVSIGNLVESIGNSAFNNCSSLASVVFGNSLTSIDNSAFYNCSSLAFVTCHATTPPTLGIDTFKGINTTTCGVPEASISAYEGSSWYNNPFTTFTAIQE